MAKLAVKTLKIELPEELVEILGASEEEATAKVREEAVLTLWKEGKISTRTAASALGLSYTQYLNLLAERKIPVSTGKLNLKAVEEILESLAAGKASRG